MTANQFPRFEYHETQKQILEVPPKTILLGNICPENKLHIDHTINKYHLTKYDDSPSPNQPICEIVNRFLQLNKLQNDFTVMFHSLDADIILSCFLLARPDLINTEPLNSLLMPVSRAESQGVIGKHGERHITKAFYKWMVGDSIKTFNSKDFQRTPQSVTELLQESFRRIEAWLNNDHMTIPYKLQPLYKIIEKVRDFNYLVVEGSSASLEPLLFDTDEDRFLVYRSFPNETTQYFIFRRSSNVDEFPIGTIDQPNTFHQFFATTEQISPNQSIWEGTENILCTKPINPGEYSYLNLNKVKSAINLLILKNRVIVDLETRKAQESVVNKEEDTTEQDEDNFIAQLTASNKAALSHHQFQTHTPYQTEEDFPDTFDFGLSNSIGPEPEDDSCPI